MTESQKNLVFEPVEKLRYWTLSVSEAQPPQEAEPRITAAQYLPFGFLFDSSRAVGGAHPKYKNTFSTGSIVFKMLNGRN